MIFPNLFPALLNNGYLFSPPNVLHTAPFLFDVCSSFITIPYFIFPKAQEEPHIENQRA